MALSQLLGSHDNEDVVVHDNTDSDDSDAVSVKSLTEKESEARFIEWYNEVCNERVAMLEAEEVYTRRIEDLETGLSDLLQSFDDAHREIKFLRNKYEPDKHNTIYTESYENIYKEREELRLKLKDNEARIQSLEEKIAGAARESQERIESLQNEIVKVKRDSQASIRSVEDEIPASARTPVAEGTSFASPDTGRGSMARSSSISIDVPPSVSPRLSHTTSSTSSIPSNTNKSNNPVGRVYRLKGVVQKQMPKPEQQRPALGNNHVPETTIALYMKKNIMPCKNELEKRLDRLTKYSVDCFHNNDNVLKKTTKNVQPNRNRSKSFREYVDTFTNKRKSYDETSNVPVNRSGMFAIVATEKLKQLDDENKRLNEQVNELECENNALSEEVNHLHSRHQRLRKLKTVATHVVVRKRFGRILLAKSRNSYC